MNAVVIRGAGGPEVLEVGQVPIPEPASGEVLVRVHSAGVNRADLLQRAGRYAPPPGVVAHIPGLEYAGEIAAIGGQVSGWRVGERVFGIVAGGAQAEYVTAPASTLARVPEAVKWTDAGAIPEAFITAHDALVTQGELRRGERVVVNAVGSGVGLAAAQVASLLGATVFGTTRSAEKLARARRDVALSGGAVLASGPSPLPAAVRDWTDGVGADVVIDLLGGDYVPAGLDALAVRGRLVLVGLLAGRSAQLMLGTVLSRRLTIRGTVLRSRTIAEKAAATTGFVRDVLPALADGRVRPVVDRVFSFPDVRLAHRLVESGETFGRVVLTP